jgi:hypothetical protein
MNSVMVSLTLFWFVFSLGIFAGIIIGRAYLSRYIE